VLRSSYHARLAPFLDLFPRAQIHVVVQERLLRHRRREVGALHEHAGVEPFWDDALDTRHHVGDPRLEVPRPVRDQFRALVAADLDRLRDWMGDDLPEWG
jgi:hypothetical protein